MNRLLWLFFIALNVSVFSNTLPPTLSNFMVKKDHPSRIYFDSSQEITASNISGFIVSDNSIVGVTINSGKTTGHYFKIASPFSYWHNSTIRYKGGSNLKDKNNNKLEEFTLRYIQNDLPEPKASDKVYFVSVNGNDKNSGLSENKPWRTISKAAETATAGSTVWIKAGDYGKEFVVFRKSGNKDKPIKFIGYKKDPGDIDSMYFRYGITKNLNPNEMPLLKGSGDGKAMRLGNKINFIIIRNIQFNHFKYGLESKGGNNIFDRLLVTNSKLIGIMVDGPKKSNNRITNTTLVNAGSSLIRTFYDYNLIDGCKIYSDSNGNNPADYYYSLYKGSHNIVRNSYAQRVGNLRHTGHGISLKGSEVATEYNLVEDNHIDNIAQAVELRHKEVKYNIVRNVLFTGYKNQQAGGVSIRDNTSYNTIENCRMVGLSKGVRFTDNTGEQGIQAGGHHNKIINTVFEDCDINISSAGLDGTSLPSTYNEFVNCTFYKSNYMFSIKEDLDGTNKLANCNIIKVQNLVKKGSGKLNIEQTYNNYYEGFKKPSGTGNISNKPDFENEGAGDFRLKSNSKLIDAGKRINDINSDFHGSVRPHGSSHDIGAFEYNSGISNVTVEADAGKDVTICKGEEVILTASGGSSYQWSTGETTKSITVSPNSTKNYTVEVSVGNISDSDTVKVEVNEVKANAGTDVAINEGEEVTLTADGGDSYLWNTGETSQNITVSPKTNTRYSVTAYKNGCEDEDSVKVNVNSNASNSIMANAGDDVEICKGDEVVLTASGGTSFLWSTGETTKSITVSPNSTKSFTVTVSEGNNSDSDTVLVEIIEVKAKAGQDVTIEEGEEVNLTANGGDSYLWSTGETTQIITVSPKSNTNYGVTAYRNGCEDDDTVKVNVNVSVPTTVDANAGRNVTICKGEEVVLTATGGTSYLWSNGEMTQSITVSPNKTKYYTVEVSVGSVADFDTVKVEVIKVKAEAGEDVTIDEGEEVTLTAKGGDSYLWSTGETTKSISVNPKSNSRYMVTAFRNGCDDDDTVKVNVNSTAPNSVSANAGNDVEICFGEEVVLTASGGSVFEWNTGETSQSITVSPGSTIIYSVKVSEGNYSDTDNVQVTVVKVDVSAGEDKIVKRGESAVLTASGGDSYLWSTGETTESIIVSPDKTKTYFVTAYKNSCENQDEVVVNIEDVIIPNPKPSTAFAGNDLSICLGETVSLTGTGGTSYSWSNGANTNSTDVSPLRTTVYVLTVYNLGVPTTDTVVVSVENCNFASNQDIQNLDSDIEFMVFPNPSSDVLNINLKDHKEELKINLISTTGSIVYRDTMDQNDKLQSKKIDLKRFAKGVYFVRIYNERKSVVKKILVI